MHPIYEINQALKDIRAIQKEINSINKHKNYETPGEDSNYWIGEKQIKTWEDMKETYHWLEGDTPEEYKQIQDKKIQEGTNIIKSIIVDLGEKWKKDPNFKKWYKKP